MANRTRFRFSIEHLWGVIVLAGIFVFVSTHPIRPYDFWWHITAGREILTSGHIPAIDVYSFTEVGQPYPSYQMFWLMEVFLYAVYKAGGPALVVFVQSLLITAAYAILFWVCKLTSHSWRIAALGVLFAAALGLNDWNVRPQAITFLLASLFLLAIYQYRQKPHWGWLFIFPVCMLVWVNSHGTFIIGLVLIAIWWAHEIWSALPLRVNQTHPRDLKRAIVPGAMFFITGLTCLVNPRGPEIINYLRTLTGNIVVQNLVTEWAPPTFNTLMGALFFIGLFTSAILLVVSFKHLDFFQLSTFLIFGYLGITTSRGSVWFGLVMAPIVAQYIALFAQRFRKADQSTARQEGSRILNLFFLVVILLLVVFSLPWFKSVLPLPAAKAGLISTETPVQATQALLEMNPPGQVFNAMSFGSYLIWAVYPHYQVFVDSRIELFPEQVWLDYLSISNAEGDWEAMLRNYGVNTLMLSQQDQSVLVDAVSHSAAWRLIYQDQLASIFTRNK